jgi:E3 ubiquitin-protein ligase HECTD2
VGVVPTLSLFDLKYIMPGLAASLENLLEYEGDVKEDFMMNFEVSYTEFDVVKSVPLKENGKNIDLTNKNRKEYVNLYIDFLLNKSIYKQFKAFYEGFHNVCASNAMIVRFESNILGLKFIKVLFCFAIVV